VSHWDLSCRDWVERLQQGRSLVPDLPLDRVAGDRAVAVFNKLRLADVPGTPTMAEAGGDWFRDVVRALFGSYDPAAAMRHIVELMLLVPKKNNKTTGGALLMLTALLLNERPRAPFALMAPVQDTAEEAFAAAEGAIGLDDVLSKKFHVRSHLKTIVHRESKADLQIMTFDPDVLTGKKFVGTLIDELHVIAKNAKASAALRQVRGGMVPYPEAFLAFITTMPDTAPVGVMKAELAKARDIRDGKREGKMLPVLYEFPPEMQTDPDIWMDPANWPMVNPNLGRSVSIGKLQELYDDAAGKGDDEIRGWASQHLNVEIGLALRSDSWAGAEYWEQQAIEPFTLDELLDRCEVVTVGIDGGGLDDLLGLAILGREKDTRRWLLWTHAWAHEIVLERRKIIATELRDFEKDRDLTIVKQPGDDVIDLADIVSRVKDSGLLPDRGAVGVDAVGIGEIVNELTTEERGFTMGADGQIVAVSQGYRLNGAIKTTERRLAGNELVHGGTRLMNRCVSNARVVDNGNAILITKAASGKAKIDPLMATFNAVYLMNLNPPAMGRSFWEGTAEEEEQTA
jgi:phage terminase large subunit-like protein